ncbi:polysaccharide deacetylase family protein [Hyphomicrobium sp.]|uniref:polysaccharide deacetylase family protein n=1 Tax=Hyphomicrobium sp. TaxID=82 RepID=UPI000F9229E6|nr:polysaccharide deacetylase family protein [Hyphomicrobium sp.]RUO99000.1 MAG: polysaccharide deacetylase [Hyphomicrobium sp.]
MIASLRLSLLTVLSASALGSYTPTAFARDDASLHACFPASALAGVPGEEKVLRGNRTFDAPIKLKGFQQAAPVADAMRGSIRRVNLPKGEKVIALTFDLCEQRGEVAGYDGRIFDYLRQQGVKATFFAGGKWIVSHRARIEQLMADPLFEIGNHTETHANLRLLSPEAIRQQVLAPQKAFEDARADLASKQCVATSPDALSGVPDQPKIFRFPYGTCNDASMKAVNDAGMLAIQWDVSTGDPDPHESAERIAAAMVNEAKPGSIIVNHANGRGWHTPEALRIAIPKLKAKGYTFATVTELLAMGKPVITAECYDRKPGDVNRYDFLGALQHPLSAASKSSATLTSTSAGAKEALKKKHKAGDPATPSTGQ